MVVQSREDGGGTVESEVYNMGIVTTKNNQEEGPSAPTSRPSQVNERRMSWGATDAPSSKVRLELPIHIHKPATLAVDTCWRGTRVPHHTLHRSWIVKLACHTHLHLQHGIDHVHAQASQPINPSHTLHPTHAVHSNLLAGKGKSTRIGHCKRMLLLLIALVVHQLVAWLNWAR